MSWPKIQIPFLSKWDSFQDFEDIDHPKSLHWKKIHKIKFLRVQKIYFNLKLICFNLFWVIFNTELRKFIFEDLFKIDLFQVIFNTACFSWFFSCS